MNDDEVKKFRNLHSIGTVLRFDSETEYVWPCLIHPARYGGTYSGAQWHAWPVRWTDQIPGEAYGSDVPCGTWWGAQTDTGVPVVGKGNSPSDAHEDLVGKLLDLGMALSNELDSNDPADVPEVRPYLL